MIRMIASLDSKLGIATSSGQEWKLKADLQHFKALTMSHGGNLLMGNSTYQAIGHPLADRHTVVATSKQLKGVETTANAVAYAAVATDDIWVVGGAQIYAQLLPLADELYLTRIDHDYQCDKFFPAWSDQDFALIEKK